MIGPAGLLMHMAGAAVAGAAFGFYVAVKAIATRARERGLYDQLQVILESSAEYAKRRPNPMNFRTDSFARWVRSALRGSPGDVFIEGGGR
jgi:hypothetical protein